MRALQLCQLHWPELVNGSAEMPQQVPKAFLWAMLHQPHQTAITPALCSSTQGSCAPCQAVEQSPLALNLFHLGLYDSKTKMATEAQNVLLMLCSENANHQLYIPRWSSRAVRSMEPSRADMNTAIFRHESPGQQCADKLSFAADCWRKP